MKDNRNNDIKKKRDKSNLENTIGVRLKKIRQDSGITITKLAEDFELSRQTINNYESGQAIPLYTLYNFCKYFGCDMEYFFGEYEEKTKVVSDICKETGLSQKAVEALRNDSDRHTADFTSLFIEHSHDIIKAIEDEIRAVEMEKIWRDCPDYPVIKKCFEHGERNARKAGRVINVYYGDTAKTILKDAESLYYQYDRAEDWCIGYTEKGERNEENLHRVLRYLLDKAKQSERLFTLQESFLGVVKEYISNETKGEST